METHHVNTWCSARTLLYFASKTSIEQLNTNIKLKVKQNYETFSVSPRLPETAWKTRVGYSVYTIVSLAEAEQNVLFRVPCSVPCCK